MDGGEEFGPWEELSSRTLMESVSLEPRTFGVLRALADVGPTKQQHLSQISQVPASTMVAILDELEAADLVSRAPDPLDRRAHQVVSLTLKGRELVEGATALTWRHEHEITSGLSTDDRQALLGALSQVFQNLKKSGRPLV